MKKLTKILSVIAIIAILVVSLSVFVSCDKKDKAATEDSTFVLEIRKADGNYEGDYTTTRPSLAGELLASKTIEIKAGQVNVYEAFAAIATKDGDTYKIAFNDTDFIIYTESEYMGQKSWAVTSGSFAAATEYTDKDFSYSYCAFNGHYSNGAYLDFIDGLTVYTIVIDGWDGTIGSQW